MRGEQLGKLIEEEDKEKEPATERRREYTDTRFRGEKRACPVPCFSLGFGDDRRGMSESRSASLSMFITSISGRKSLTSFAYRFFHLNRPPGLRLAFDTAKRYGKFDHIQYYRSKESCSRESRKRRVFLC